MSKGEAARLPGCRDRLLVSFFLSFLLFFLFFLSFSLWRETGQNGRWTGFAGIASKGVADWRRRWAYDDGTHQRSKQSSRQARTPSSASSERAEGATVASLYYFLGGPPIAVAAKPLGALGREKISLCHFFFFPALQPSTLCLPVPSPSPSHPSGKSLHRACDLDGSLVLPCIILLSSWYSTSLLSLSLSLFLSSFSTHSFG